ncbi:hypothetical protein BAUCODRAFT_52542, partial [Baudoinia panamericana UAMH 10762]
MAITILPLLEADIPSFVKIELEAFRSHPRMPMLFPMPYQDDLYAFYNERKTISFRDDECRFMKAVDDETGNIVAVSEWTFSLDSNKTAIARLSDPNEQPPANWPKGGNWGLRQWFKIEWEEWRRENLAGKAYILLDILVTNPTQQRRGAGAKLLAWGCEQADKHGVMMCLESTPAGLGLYERFGFRQVRTLKADMRDFGWDKPYDE